MSYFTRDENGAMLSERGPGGARYYFLPDGLGSTIATTGSNGAIVNSYKYDPYGGVVTENETSVRPTSFRFAGGLYTSSLSLHKFGKRWYDQTLNRWTQQDAIDQTGDLKQGNRYLYVGDNPVNYTDPMGTCIVLDCSTWDDVGDVASGALEGGASGAIEGFVTGGPAGIIPGAATGAVSGASTTALHKWGGSTGDTIASAWETYSTLKSVKTFTTAPNSTGVRWLSNKFGP